ncbi:hypothetical protein C8J57DRAFT_85168 [Mycena rebaudengoi]|nr:hypothetical protein C8J57DRAFT_85168 [Mycena rebaudengoi]
MSIRGSKMSRPLCFILHKRRYWLRFSSHSAYTLICPIIFFDILITMSPFPSIVTLSARDEIRVQPMDGITNFADAWPAETYRPTYDAGPAPPVAPWIGPAGCVLFFIICGMGIYICHRFARVPPWLMETLDDFAKQRFRDANGDMHYPEEVLPLNPKTYEEVKACVLAKRRASAAESYKASPADKAMPSSTVTSSVVDPNVKKEWDSRASVVSAAPSYKTTCHRRDAPSNPSNESMPWSKAASESRHSASQPQPQPLTPRKSKDAGAPLPPILRPAGSRW